MGRHTTKRLKVWAPGADKRHMDNKNTLDIGKLLRQVSREENKGMKPGGPMGSKKGKRGYSRKAKHNKGNHDA